MGCSNNRQIKTRLGQTLTASLSSGGLRVFLIDFYLMGMTSIGLLIGGDV